MTNYDEDETSWTTITLVFTIIIATLGYRIFGPDRAQEPVVVPETKSTEKQKEEEPKEETVEISARTTVQESSPKVTETINEEKEESNSTGSSEFERISNSEANDMPDSEDVEQVEPKVEMSETIAELNEARIETSAIDTSQAEETSKVEMEETRFLSFVDTTLEGQSEPEKEDHSQVTPDDESCVTESPESEDSKMSMHVNFDSVHDDDEVLEASKSDEETPVQVAAEQVADPIPVIAQTAVTTEVTETIEDRSNSPSIQTEPSDDEDPLQELKSSSPILVSDQDVELVKKELEKSAESVEETEKVNESNIEKKESKTEGETEDAFIDTEEDIVKTIDIAKNDAAIDAIKENAPILANEGIKLDQDDSMKAAVHEKPIVPTSEPAAIETKPVAVEKEMDESLTGLAEYVPEESVVQTENSSVEDNKLVSESSENVGNDTNTTVADESLSGLEEISLPELECTAVGDEIQDGKWADNTILSSAGDARAGDLKAAVEDDVSEQEIKNAQLQEINKLLEEHNMLDDDVKVDDQVKMYTG